MSDTLSNALRGGSLLDRIANPTVVNPLAAYTGALQTANAVWANRKMQAEQAAGEAFQNSIGPDGTPNQTALLQNLKNNPAAALASQQSAQLGQNLDQTTYDTHMKRLTTGAAGFTQVLAQNNGNAPLDAIKTFYANAVRDGHMTQQEADQLVRQFGPDAAQNGNIGRQMVARNMDVQTALTAGRPSVTYQDVGGHMVPLTTQGALSPQPGQMTPGGAPVLQKGLSPEAGAEISTITDANGNPITDTKAGHMKAGRVTPDGSLAPGYSEATASPTMVSALRGQEGTPDGRTSVAGARGQMQVTPGFFKQYARSGESFDSKRDVEEVAQRGIAALEKKYPNDPARVAVAYFSGEGNVAPPGSPTPYKQDLKDANGTPTSAYVAGVIGRYKPDQTGGTGPKPGGTTGPAPGTVEAGRLTAEDSAKMGQDLVRRAEQVPNNRADYQNMLYDLKKLDTMGPGTERETIINAFLQKLTGYGITMSKDQVAGSESFNKIANLIASRQLASLGPTDSRQALAMGANPHLDLSKLGNERIIHMLQGNEDAVQAKASAWQNWLKTHGSGTYGQFSTEFNKHFDPRVFQSLYMEPQEIDDFRRSLKPDEATRFKEDYRYAQQQGWAR